MQFRLQVDGKEYVAISSGGTPTSSNGGTATTLQVFRKIRFPLALPMIIVGYMVGAIFGLLGAAFTEAQGAVQDLARGIAEDPLRRGRRRASALASSCAAPQLCR